MSDLLLFCGSVLLFDGDLSQFCDSVFTFRYYDVPVHQLIDRVFTI
jgi:hypothetical protein